ncbi:hypothetical protein FN846DRAFT_902400 [Sphaerosporella brunnea]|uniref:Uncharacterized protein n=1 Tax=Sphaerosporella brunnea TaxID=1250544 RepID=A0A5J5F9D9_9PEZI|nr:hypothetical protein FN846DRAFT_902400 [Sphaerosporella brunnea]
MDISLIGTKRDAESLQVERAAKRLRNDDQERCDAIDTIGSAIISHAGLADDAVFRTDTVTGRQPEITKVTEGSERGGSQPADTQALAHKELTNCKRGLREVLVVFTRVSGGRYLSHNYWETVVQPSPTPLMQHLLSAEHRYQFVAFGGGDEQIVRDMVSLHEDRPPRFSRFPNDVDTVTFGEAIQAVEAWIRNPEQGARRLKKMLEFELNVHVLWAVPATDRGKHLHEHVQAINERRKHSTDITKIARAFNQSCKQRWIRDAEDTTRYFYSQVTDLAAAAGRAGMSIKDLRDRIHKPDSARIRRNVVAHEVTANDIPVAIKYARDPLQESMMGWSFHAYWGVTPETYDVLADGAKQRLLQKSMRNMRSEVAPLSAPRKSPNNRHPQASIRHPDVRCTGRPDLHCGAPFAPRAGPCIGSPAEKYTALATELDTVRSNLSASKDAVQSLTKKNTERETTNAGLEATVQTFINKGNLLCEQVTELLARDKGPV